MIINGGDGDDTIYNEFGDNVTIDGGAGNDSIDNHDGSNVLFTYTAGNGNDLIQGFNATSTLRIGEGTGTYSKATVGSDIIVTVGDGKITLEGAASLSALNIDGKEQASTTLTLTDSDAAKVTLDSKIITADASARTKAINISANKLNNTISGGKGSDKINHQLRRQRINQRRRGRRFHFQLRIRQRDNQRRRGQRLPERRHRQ